MIYPDKVRFISRVQVTSAGGALDADYLVTSNPSAQDIIPGFVSFSSPVTTTSAPTQEGVDFPFFTRFLEVDSYPNQQWSVWKRKFYTIIADGQYTLGTPGPLILAPVDASILTQPSLGSYFPIVNYIKWKNDAAYAASKAFNDVPGSWIFAIPATTYTITVCELLTEIQEHLMENANGGASFDSGLWSVAEVLAYLNNRTSRFLVETGILQVRNMQAANSADPVYNLPSDLIDLRRAAWTSGSSTIGLGRIDSLQADLGFANWESPVGTPSTYVLVPEQSLELRLAPQPSVNATLDLVYIRDPSAITNDCSIMPIPDEWVMFIKWGVIADMLAKEGEANDPQRAQYAEQRYMEGVEIARLYLGTHQ